MILQAVKPWISSEDIQKGSRWLTELSSQLRQQNFAIICLTPENLQSDWILFEAGAISTAIESTNVCPLLIDLQQSDITGPLTQFQATAIAKDEFFKLIKTVNSKTPTPIHDASLETLYNLLWPQLSLSLNDAIQMLPNAKKTTREPQELLEEVLLTVRNLQRHLTVDRHEQMSKPGFRREVAPALQGHLHSMYRFELERLDEQLSHLQAERTRIEQQISAAPHLVGNDSNSIAAQRELLIYRMRDLSQRRIETANRMHDLLEYIESKVPSGDTNTDA